MTGELRHTYSAEKVTLALTVLAGCNGNGRQAAPILKDEFDLVISPETLYRWIRDTHKEQYEAIRQELLPELQGRAAERYMDAADRLQEKALEVAEATSVDKIPDRDRPGAARNLMVAAATASDKALLLTGQPTVRVEKSASDLLRSLQSKLGIKPKQVENLEERTSSTE